MGTPVEFSPSAAAWLEANDAWWVWDWLFALAAGEADLGLPLPGFQPDVYSCLVSSPSGKLVGVAVAEYLHGFKILKFDDP